MERYYRERRHKQSSRVFTRTNAFIAVAGVVLIGAALFLLPFGGSSNKNATGDNTNADTSTNSNADNGGGSQQSSAPQGGKTPTAARATATATRTPAAGDTGSIEGAVDPIPDGFVAPVETMTLGLPLARWASIGDRFGTPRAAGQIHGGINLIVDANAPSNVLAPCDGTVDSIGTSDTHGLVLAIDCGGSWRVVLAHLGTATIAVRQKVVTGSAVATVQDFLDFEVRYRGVAVDPELLIDFDHGKPLHQVEDTPVDPEVIETPTPAPSATTTPSATPTPKATTTPTPRPAATPVPDGGSQPEDTPVPEPTSVPEAPTTAPTPIPPPPTATPRPTQTPTPLPPTETPTPRPHHTG